jgi:TPR repeat protein
MGRLVFIVSFTFSVVSLIGLVQRAVARQQAAPIPRLSAKEIAQLQGKADAGNSDAQVSLGRAYEDGNGVSQSDRQAVRWYRASGGTRKCKSAG